MTAERVAPSRRGRPRLQATDQAIFAAAADLIRERGYDGFSMAAVADRAGVAKTTVYRRWPTRSHLVLATMSSVMSRVGLFDTGDVHADLASFARSLATALRAPGTLRLVAELALASAQRPELADGFHRLFTQRRAAALATVEQAAAAGQLRPGVDPDLLIDQVSGALHYRMMVSGEGPSDAYAERLVGAVLDGHATHPL
jgi:AcrR family transcriptional regulator